MTDCWLSFIFPQVPVNRVHLTMHVGPYSILVYMVQFRVVFYCIFKIFCAVSICPWLLFDCCEETPRLGQFIKESIWLGASLQFQEVRLWSSWQRARQQADRPGARSVTKSIFRATVGGRELSVNCLGSWNLQVCPYWQMSLNKTMPSNPSLQLLQ